MSPIAEHHFDQSLAALADTNESIEYREAMMWILINLQASDRNIFDASEEEWIKVRSEIFDSIVKYKREVTTSSRDM